MKVLTTLVLMCLADAVAAQQSARDYANSRLEQCNSVHEQERSRGSNPFSVFPDLDPAAISQQAFYDCIARQYLEDSRFVSGYFALLAELPGDQARDMHEQVSDHIEAHTRRADPQGPWKLAMNGCKLIEDTQEMVACLEAVLQSVPDRLR